MTDGSGDQAKKIAAVLSVAAVVAIIVALLMHGGSSSSKIPQGSNQGQPVSNGTSQAQSAISQSEMKPQVEDVTIHPYELIKNPFLKKNHIVRLDTHSYPILLDGNLLNYQVYTGMPNIVSKELVGARFERMLDEETALFEVLGFNRAGVMSNGGTDEGMARIGELAVLVPTGSAQLDPEELWSVEPLGTLKGTNAFGATISVPLVRFDGYWRYQQISPSSAINGTAKIAVDLVKSHIKPTEYLKSLKPSFDQSEWQPINNEWVSEGRWEVCYRVRVLQGEVSRENFVIPCWEVNVKTKTVKILQLYKGDIPVPDDGSTSRYFDTIN